MTYLIAIKTAVILFPILAFLFTGPYILYQYHRFASINPIKTIVIYSFIFYLLCAYFLVILPLPTLDSVKNNPPWMIQTIPFHFIIDFIKETPLIIHDPSTYLKTIFHPSFYVVAFNILLFIPLGAFLRYIKGYSLKKIIKVSFLVSLFFEFTQVSRLYGIYPRPYRLCDIDDLILNTIGGGIGYLIMLDLEQKIPSKKELEEISLKKGEQVSTLRRITLFHLDLILYLIAITFLNKIHPILVFILYFTIIPIVYHQKTLGSSFLNIRFKKTTSSILYYIRPYAIYSYYLLFPYFIFTIINAINYYFPSSNIKIPIALLGIITIFLFYIINLLILCIKKSHYYDSFFKTQLESTIKDKNRKSN